MGHVFRQALDRSCAASVSEHIEQMIMAVQRLSQQSHASCCQRILWACNPAVTYSFFSSMAWQGLGSMHLISTGGSFKLHLARRVQNGPATKSSSSDKRRCASEMSSPISVHLECEQQGLVPCSSPAGHRAVEFHFSIICRGQRAP